MIHIEYTTNDTIFYATDSNGYRIDFSKWVNTDNAIYYFPLAELIDNDYANLQGETCAVPYEHLYELTEEDRFLLGLPKFYSLAIRLRTDGLLNDSGFNYIVEFMSSVPDGELFVHQLHGNILNIQNHAYLLTREQYELIKTVFEYNSFPQDKKTTDTNLSFLGKIKGQAQKAQCHLDNYLQNENVVVPEKIKIDIVRDSNGYTIAPTIEDGCNENFQHSFDRSRKVLSIYPTQDSQGVRTRVVLNEGHRVGLQVIKEARKSSPDVIRKIVESPTEYFSPDEFDIGELYSDRVIEYGLYRPRFSQFISSYKSCWLPGCCVSTPQNGTVEVMVENAEDLLELDEAIQDAEAQQAHVVHYKEATISLDDAKTLRDTASKQLSQPTIPIEGITRKEKKILVIKDNAEEVDFNTSRNITTTKFRFSADKYLNPTITLKHHQKEGVAWFQYLFSHNVDGCLMADDMGLGKTLQVLYFIDWHARNNRMHNPYLIVAPVSLLENWRNEYNRFFTAPRLSVNVITSGDVPRQFNQQAISELQKMDIVLASYETVRNAQLNFCAVDFDVVALDEAQKIKTPGTLTTNACKALKGKFKIAMTGTPVENSLLDLWSIMDFCTPGMLGSARQFAKKYVYPLKHEDTDIAALGEELHAQLGLFLMRRMKNDVAKDLPQKKEHKECCLMPAPQLNLYMQAIKERPSGENMLQVLFKIRKISECPYLFCGTHESKHIDFLINDTARLKLTVNYLDSIRDRQEKAILFADQKDTQHMLQRLVWERYRLIASIINGDTPTTNTRQRESRQSCIDRFQGALGFGVIIMSPIAAGVGLNVTGANHIIHYSRHWNPAKENQATDRAYRIGQTLDVHVYYPMATIPIGKSFDIVLDELLSRKTTLASNTIFPTERIEVTQDEILHNLFN